MRSIDVMCPGFIADCLETLGKIGMEACEASVEAGDKTFHNQSALIDRHDRIAALAIKLMQGWHVTLPEAAELERQRPLAAASTPPHRAAHQRKKRNRAARRMSWKS